MMGLLSHQPLPTEPCLQVRGSSEAAPGHTNIKILSWNLQFCAGRDHLFFYEGGKVVQVPLADVTKTMNVVAEIIAEYQPDIVLLQEVDRGSRRTHYQDELLGILRQLDSAGHKYLHVVSTPYHRCRFVPAPSHEMMGKVDLHLACLSKFPIQAALRHQLPLLNESCLRQQFNLKRALMEIRLTVEGGGEFVVFNTHLSAFAYNDGTPEKEIAMLEKHLDRCEEQVISWVLAGDFNMLPPGDNPERLGVINNDDHSSYYNRLAQIESYVARYAQPQPEPEPQSKRKLVSSRSARSPIELLCNKYRSALDMNAWSKLPPGSRGLSPHNTYVPLNTNVPDRVLDWFFAGSRTPIAKYEVLRHKHLSVASDHLPLLLEVKL
eukprot:Transcript_4724.p1 GENE.Transcript_4724~~Transcript_4724.p1  ORF type:complete len:396 (-),score=55.80 Transcript_4724:664-1797(-)